MRLCKLCGVDISALYHNRKYCESIICRRQMSQLKAKKYRDLNPVRNNDNWNRYSKTMKGRTTLLLNYAKDRSTKLGLPFDLDRAFIFNKLANGRCEITGETFGMLSDDGYRVSPRTPSLDRIVPSKGYVKDNVRMVCFIINVMHHEWSDSLLLEFATLVVENSNKLKM